jgi:hypothetical protein
LTCCRLCPIFQVSNVSGENLPLLKMFLNLLSTRMTGLDDLPAEFQIDDTYSVPVSIQLSANMWLEHDFSRLILIVKWVMEFFFSISDEIFFLNFVFFFYACCDKSYLHRKYCTTIIFLLEKKTLLKRTYD